MLKPRFLLLIVFEFYCEGRTLVKTALLLGHLYFNFSISRNLPRLHTQRERDQRQVENEQRDERGYGNYSVY